MIVNEPSIAALAASVRSERVSVAALVEALSAERELLAAGDTDALADVASRKRELLLHIAHLGDHRNRLLERCGVTPDRKGMEQLLAASPAATALRTEWSALMDSAKVAQRLNQENGAHIEAGMRSNQQAFSVLMSAAQAGTYGPRGRAMNPLASRALASA